MWIHSKPSLYLVWLIKKIKLNFDLKIFCYKLQPEYWVWSILNWPETEVSGQPETEVQNSALLFLVLSYGSLTKLWEGQGGDPLLTRLSDSSVTGDSGGLTVGYFSCLAVSFSAFPCQHLPESSSVLRKMLASCPVCQSHGIYPSIRLPTSVGKWEREGIRRTGAGCHNCLKISNENLQFFKKLTIILIVKIIHGIKII